MYFWKKITRISRSHMAISILLELELVPFEIVNGFGWITKLCGPIYVSLSDLIVARKEKIIDLEITGSDSDTLPIAWMIYTQKHLSQIAERDSYGDNVLYEPSTFVYVVNVIVPNFVIEWVSKWGNNILFTLQSNWI